MLSIFDIINKIILPLVTLLSSCFSLEESKNEVSDTDRIIQVYDYNEIRIALNIVGGYNDINDERIVRIYDLDE